MAIPKSWKDERREDAEFFELVNTDLRKRRAFRDGTEQGGCQYIVRLPFKVPKGRKLVHNRVRPHGFAEDFPLGLDGFRAWLQRGNDPELEICECGWAPGMGTHYRVAGIAEGADEK